MYSVMERILLVDDEEDICNLLTVYLKNSNYDVVCFGTGTEALEFLSGRRLLPLYRCVFLLCTLAGAVWEPEAVWQLTDLCNALMALPNLSALLLLSPEALALLREWTQKSALWKAQKMEKPY